MKTVTIRQRILLSFLAILVVMIAVAVLSFTWLRQAEDEALIVEDNTVPALYLSGQLRTAWTEADFLMGQFAAQESATELKRIGNEIAANRDAINGFAAAYDKTVDSERDRQDVSQLKALETQYRSVADTIMSEKQASLASGQQTDWIAAVVTRLKPIADRIGTTLDGIVASNRSQASASTQRIVSIVRSGEIGLAIGAAVALALATICGLLLFRAITVPLGKLVNIVALMQKGDFTDRLNLGQRDEFNQLADGVNAMADDLTTLIGQVQRSSIQVNTSITEVAATSKEQQATASEIAATTTEIGATAKEIAATSHELVRTMDEVSQVAEQTASLAGGGQAGLSRMEDTMRHVMEAASAINGKLAVLSEKAGNINQVVTTITRVADQTNLLSLNAAIEAEKAGQYGRGFAVVATEIRRLADQTAVSSFDIEQMVKDIQSAVAAGVMGMDKFSEEVRRGMTDVQQVGGQLSEIIQQVQGLVPRFEIANEGMQAQSTGAGQISEALSQLSEAVQQTVESLQQSTLTIDELNQVASGLRNSISRFRLRA